jgi:hypothetical protein
MSYFWFDLKKGRKTRQHYRQSGYTATDVIQAVGQGRHNDTHVPTEHVVKLSWTSARKIIFHDVDNDKKQCKTLSIKHGHTFSLSRDCSGAERSQVMMHSIEVCLFLIVALTPDTVSSHSIQKHMLHVA